MPIGLNQNFIQILPFTLFSLKFSTTKNYFQISSTMYGYNYTNNIHYGGYSTEYYGGAAHVPLPAMVVPPEALASLPLPPPLVIPGGSDYDSLSPLKSEINGYSSSEYSSYGSPSSATSYGGINNFQRSISSHSLQKNTDGYYPVVSSPTGFLDLDCSPVRKVFSAGDLHVSTYIIFFILKYHKFNSCKRFLIEPIV